MYTFYSEPTTLERLSNMAFHVFMITTSFFMTVVLVVICIVMIVSVLNWLFKKLKK